MRSEPRSIGHTTNNASHGLIGSYFVSLSRRGGIGWIAFFVILMLYIFTLWFHAVRQPNIIVVDQQGNMLGRVNFEDPLARTDAEIKGTIKRFGSCYWSLNASTFRDDVACVLSMMDTMPQKGKTQSLRELHIAALEESNLMAIVETAQNKTSVEFYDDEIRVLERRSFVDADGGDYVLVRAVLAGEIQAIGTRKKVKEFRQEVTLRLVPRTDFSLLGAKVHAIQDI
ncbi:hypothetical protein [Ferrimonas kyonanensis]|uniref:hypothetical protein n=1 Tax=Ferrimonas kyonanensis TaxID=364763 RepID=UPI00054DB78E|nr:hypothetical protein [Ferrimonas kyonanensis]